MFAEKFQFLVTIFSAYDIQFKGAVKSNGGQEARSTKVYSNIVLNQGFTEKMRKYSEIAKASNISF